MDVIRRNITDHLSYYIKPEGNVTPVMPDQEATFPLKFIQDFVGPRLEIACFTSEGYALIRNPEGTLQGLPVNSMATSLLSQATGKDDVIRGRAFLIHPEHFDRRLIPAA